jgi:lycopene cyclase domain-containing protein
MSILIVGIAYILWDIAATARGDWAFNPEFLLGLNIFNLPVEEVLFFVTVPYACLFIYETLAFYLKEKEILKSEKPFLALAAGFLVLAIVFYYQDYTATVSIFTGLFLAAAVKFFPELLRSKLFWLYAIITLIPFLLVNYFLTSLPIVTYGDQAFSSVRFITIPIEDFLYSFSLLSFYLFFYLIFKEKWLIKSASQ